MIWRQIFCNTTGVHLHISFTYLVHRCTSVLLHCEKACAYIFWSWPWDRGGGEGGIPFVVFVGPIYHITTETCLSKISKKRNVSVCIGHEFGSALYMTNSTSKVGILETLFGSWEYAYVKTNNVHNVKSFCTLNDCFYSFITNDTTPFVVFLDQKPVAIPLHNIPPCQPLP